MIKAYSIIPAILFLAALCGCSKNNDKIIPVVASTWSVVGVSYTATSTYFSSDSTTLTAEHVSTGQYEAIYVFFNKTPVAGNYIVINGAADVTNPGQVGIGTYNEQTGLSLWSANGGSAKVTFVKGKVNVLFNNITMNEITSSNVNTGDTFQSIGPASANISE